MPLARERRIESIGSALVGATNWNLTVTAPWEDPVERG
jgi:hypothetical protein